MLCIRYTKAFRGKSDCPYTEFLGLCVHNFGAEPNYWIKKKHRQWWRQEWPIVVIVSILKSTHCDHRLNPVLWRIRTNPKYLPIYILLMCFFIIAFLSFSVFFCNFHFNKVPRNQSRANWLCNRNYFRWNFSCTNADFVWFLWVNVSAMRTHSQSIHSKYTITSHTCFLLHCSWKVCEFFFFWSAIYLSGANQFAACLFSAFGCVICNKSCNMERVWHGWQSHNDIESHFFGIRLGRFTISLTIRGAPFTKHNNHMQFSSGIAVIYPPESPYKTTTTAVITWKKECC